MPVRPFAMLLCAVPLSVFSQVPGSIDPSLFTGKYASGDVHALIALAGGKVLAGGEFVSFDHEERNSVVELNANLNVYAGFNPGSGTSGLVVNCLFRQNDGKFMAAGVFETFNGTDNPSVVRLMPDGSVDNTFHSLFDVDEDPLHPDNDIVNALAVQTDGKIILGGGFSKYNAVNYNGLVRLQADGTPDPGFISGAANGTVIYSVAILPGGKIMISGNFSTYGGYNTQGMARLFADGSVDTTFTAHAGGSVPTVKAFAVLPDDKILAAGCFYSWSGSARPGIVRMYDNGSVDLDFDPGTGAEVGDLTLLGNLVNAIQLLPDGKYLIAGAFTSYDGVPANNIERITDNGSPDMGFNVGTGPARALTYSTTSVSLCLLVLGDGSLLVGGNFTAFDGKICSHIMHLNSDGSAFAGYLDDAGFDNTVNKTFPQSDGSIFVVGKFTRYNDALARGIERIWPDGSIDTAFHADFGLNDVYEQISDLIVLPGGKIMVSGEFDSVNNIPIHNIARLFPDGSLDMGFDPGSSTDDAISDMELDPDGKIMIVGGYFATYNGVTRHRIARINPDGSLDETFDPGLGFNGQVHMVHRMPDSTYLVAGEYGKYNGYTRKGLVHLYHDGTLDLSLFVKLSAEAHVYRVLVQDDGKYLICGDFTKIDTLNTFCVQRINPDGSPDLSFVNGLASDKLVEGISLRDDGSILIGGVFTEYGGVQRNKVALLHPDGSLDTSFDPGAIGNGSVSWFTELPDGKLLISGTFTAFGGTTRNHLAQLVGPAPVGCGVPSGPYADNITASSAELHWNPVTGAVKYQIRYRVSGSGTWSLKNASSTSKVLGGLAPATTYDYTLRTLCASGPGTSGDIQHFTTLPLREGNADADNAWELFPDPASDILHVTAGDRQGENATVEIFDLQGKCVYNGSVTDNADISIPVQNLANGLFVLRIRSGNTEFVKEFAVAR